MSFLGMSRTFLGTAFPAIRSSLDLTLLQPGTLYGLLQLGFTTAVFVGGPISDIIKKSTILMLGCLLMGASLILFGFSDWFWLSLIGITFIGMGGGMIESSSNPLLIPALSGTGIDGDEPAPLLLCHGILGRPADHRSCPCGVDSLAMGLHGIWLFCPDRFSLHLFPESLCPSKEGRVRYEADRKADDRQDLPLPLFNHLL